MKRSYLFHFICSFESSALYLVSLKAISVSLCSSLPLILLKLGSFRSCDWSCSMDGLKIDNDLALGERDGRKEKKKN